MGKSERKKAQALLDQVNKRIKYFQQEHDDWRRHWENAKEHMEELRRQKYEAELYLASVKG